MTDYRILSCICFCLTLGFIARDIQHRFKSWAGAGRAAIEQWKLVRASMSEFRGVLYLVSLLSFVVLALTGFGPVLLFGDHLTGTMLIIHVTVAPVFALSLSVVAVLWAHRMRFRLPLPEEQTVHFWYKLLFWAILLLSLPLLLSIIAGMYPVFGTEGEESLIQVHGYSALLLSCAALIHTLFITKISKEE